MVGHVGLIPSKATWTGGFKAVGKTAESAMMVYRQVKDLEAAGAFAAEIEVVPDRIAAEIAKRTSLLMLSMGAGTGGDAQYLFAEDVLGYTRGHRPRHAKVYRDFAAEYRRLQQERVAAFKEFSPTSPAAPIRRASTWCRSPTPSSRPSSTACRAESPPPLQTFPGVRVPSGTVGRAARSLWDAAAMGRHPSAPASLLARSPASPLRIGMTTNFGATRPERAPRAAPSRHGHRSRARPPESRPRRPPRGGSEPFVGDEDEAAGPRPALGRGASGGAHPGAALPRRH